MRKKTRFDETQPKEIKHWFKYPNGLFYLIQVTESDKTGRLCFMVSDPLILFIFTWPSTKACDLSVYSSTVVDWPVITIQNKPPSVFPFSGPLSLSFSPLLVWEYYCLGERSISAVIRWVVSSCEHWICGEFSGWRVIVVLPII